MNGAQLHVLVNHVSLFAVAFGVLALIAAIICKDAGLRMFAAFLFIIDGIFGVIADQTGHGAAQILKVMSAEYQPYIHEHAQAADFAKISGLVVAVLAIGLEIAVRKKPSWAKSMQWILLVVAIHGFTVFTRTAYLGGEIRHSELRPGSESLPAFKEGGH